MNNWRVNYRLSGCPKYEQRIRKGDGRILLEGLEKNKDYEFKVICATDPRVFVKHPKVVNSGDDGQILVVFVGISCVIDAI